MHQIENNYADSQFFSVDEYSWRMKLTRITLSLFKVTKLDTLQHTKNYGLKIIRQYDKVNTDQVH